MQSIFPLLQLHQLRQSPAITNRVENYLCVSADLVFFPLTLEVLAQEVLTITGAAIKTAP